MQFLALLATLGAAWLPAYMAARVDQVNVEVAEEFDESGDETAVMADELDESGDETAGCTDSIWESAICDKKNKPVLSKTQRDKNGRPLRVPWCSEQAKCKSCKQCHSAGSVPESAIKPAQPPQRPHKKDVGPEEQDDDKCTESNSWVLPSNHFLEEVVGKGAHGTIVKIKPPTGFKKRYSEYAIKRGANKGDKLDIKKERDIMAAANDKCQGYGVMEVTEPEPCISDGKPLRKFKYAMVTPLMPQKDLEKWYNKYWSRIDKEDKWGCATSIARQLIKGLQCLHSANYIHGDFKPDNVFVGALDKHSCAADVRVADFGLSTKITNSAGKTQWETTYPEEYLWISGHLSESMFDGGNAYDIDGKGDRLGLMDSKGDYYVSHPVLDWCSLINMMESEFGLMAVDLFHFVREDSELGADFHFWEKAYNGWKDLSVRGACGRYGQDRSRKVPNCDKARRETHGC